jgi:hypothetical protein
MPNMILTFEAAALQRQLSDAKQELVRCRIEYAVMSGEGR